MAVSTSLSKMVNNENLWNKDYRKLDVGIALSHFTIAAQELNFEGKFYPPLEEDFKTIIQCKAPDDTALIAVWK